jgi:hypothetical protein
MCDCPFTGLLSSLIVFDQVDPIEVYRLLIEAVLKEADIRPSGGCGFTLRACMLAA